MLLFSVLTLLALLPARMMGQALDGTVRTPQTDQQAQDYLTKMFPVLKHIATIEPRHYDFPVANRSLIIDEAPEAGLRAAQAAADTVPFLGTLAYQSSWYDEATQKATAHFGIYSFSSANPTSFTPHLLTRSAYGRYGSQLRDGHIYMPFWTYTATESSVVVIYDIDTDTWEYTSKNVGNRTELLAMATAQAKDGTVFGEFMLPNNKFEWGTVNYATQERTTIGPAQNIYLALGITSDNRLYGISRLGDLYSIDTKTGKETLIGATGIETWDKIDQTYYAQSGEIDQKTNTFYWMALNQYGRGSFCTVDLTTGKATALVANTNQCQLYGMMINRPEAADATPARATIDTVMIDNESLDGSITFTAPTKTVGGSAISGQLSYTVSYNDTQLATGTVNAGDKATAYIELPSRGNYGISVVTANAAGQSPKATKWLWAGFDVPKAVNGVTATLSANTTFSVKWNKSVGGFHDLPLGKLTYDLTRANERGEAVTVATGLTDTTYTDQLPTDELLRYHYTVTPRSDGMAGETASSAVVLAGTTILPDWGCQIDKQDLWQHFTVIDNNKDGYTWTLNTTARWTRCDSHRYHGNDDWLITPPVRMEKNHLYRLEFRMKNDGGNYNHTLEVGFGKSNTVAGMSQIAKESTQPTSEWKEYYCEVVPTESADFFFGFHDNTAKGLQLYLYLDTIYISKGAEASAPEAVSKLTITPAVQGALKATIGFHAPTTNLLGQSIQTVDSFVVSRNGTPVATLGRAAAGDSVTATVGVPGNGVYDFAITPYNATGAGRMADASAFVGVDAPLAPSNVRLADNGSNILATWDAISGAGQHEGYVNPSDVKVAFYTGNLSYGTVTNGTLKATSDKGATSVTVPQVPEVNPSGANYQDLYTLIARAESDAGNSPYTLSSYLVVGPSIALPYHESLKGGYIENNFMWAEGNTAFENRNRAASWHLSTDMTADNDGGAFVWSNYSAASNAGRVFYTVQAGDEVALCTPKVKLTGAAKPMLVFSMYAKKGSQDKLRLLVQTPDGQEHTIETFDLSQTTADGWTQHSFSLGDYSSQKYVMVKFLGISGGSSTYIGIDNVNIVDQLDDNLAAVGITAPKAVTAGHTAKVNVTVRNWGAKVADGYTVALYAGSKFRASADAPTQLAVMADTTLTIDMPMPINEPEGNEKLYAYIDFGDDLYNADNTSDTLTLVVQGSRYTPVSDLAATDDGSAVGLTWSKPAQPEPKTVTEGFDTYEPFTQVMGDWTNVDGDRGTTGNILSGLATVPGSYEPMSFMAFNPGAINEQLVLANPGLSPLSGTQYAAAFYSYDAHRGELLRANNWLISPLLSGRKQTVSFYAMNIRFLTRSYDEIFDVLYSTAETPDTASFKTLKANQYVSGSNYISGRANWMSFSYELPEGATYFAIRHHSLSFRCYMLGIDNVTYEQGTVGANDSITSYAIYRDGVQVGTVDGNTTTWQDKGQVGSHVYNVTAFYTSPSGRVNESPFSNDATITDGIATISADKEPVDVYTTDGKLVKRQARDLSGLPTGVYVVKGKSVIKK